MKVLLSWLREFAPIDGDPDRIAAQLTELGMELESVVHIGEGLDGIVVAKVLAVRPHPDADRIRLVDVDAGNGESLQICCGASNMAEGDLVPLATVGTVMPGGMEIAKRKMRGQDSSGMLCSAVELNLGDDSAGLLLLPDDLTPGTDIAEALGIAGDVVYEFDALPNRPDTLSMLGVARDLAAHQRVPFELPSYDLSESGTPSEQLCDVRIQAPELCGRFVARVVSAVALGESPRWMAQRLSAAGMRPINNVVDVSNYVMLELGQPNHAYDLAKLAGGSIGVRWARDGEVMRTLDDVERTLCSDDGVIVDAEDLPIGIAGVMGGASTEISTATADVVLEAAWWDPAVVAATSARLNLHSEASLRFKRGTDPEMAPLALERMSQLLSDIGGAQLHPGTVDVDGDRPVRVVVPVRPDKVNSVLGVNLGTDEMAALIEPIGYRCEQAEDHMSVTVPTWRPDSTIEVDVIEEIGRHYGLSRIDKTVPVSPHTGGLDTRQRDVRVLRRALVGAGLSEAMPMPFLAPGDLERCGLDAGGLTLANPLAAEESVLRTSLLPGLLKAVAHNERHRMSGVRLFEIGRVFGLDDGRVLTDVVESEVAGRVLSGEREQLGVVLAGCEAPEAVRLIEQLLRAVGRWCDPADAPPSGRLGELPGVALEAGSVPGLHPGRAAVVSVSGRSVGQVGEVDPTVLSANDIGERVAWIQLDLVTLFDRPASVPRARPVSRFPSSDIDLAFVVDEELPAANLRSTLLSADLGVTPVAVDLFDVFRSDQLGAGRKSMAYRIRFQEPDRTLTDSEVAEARAAMIEAAGSVHGAQLRG